MYKMYNNKPFIKYIICFLCKTPNENFLNFITTLKSINYDIYVCVDDNKYIPNKKLNIKFIQVNNNICYKSGYRSIVAQCNNRSCSKDKALYYFNKNDINYDYIWLIEDDTFVPSKNTIRNIDNKYHNIDLLTPKIVDVNIRKWGWGRVLLKKQFFNLRKTCNDKYFDYDKYMKRKKVMTCGIRLSKKYMSYINNFVNKNNTLFMDEIFFMYIGILNNVIIREAKELSTITWNNKWKERDININNMYHPIKNFEKQKFFRKNLKHTPNCCFFIDNFLLNERCVIK